MCEKCECDVRALVYTWSMQEDNATGARGHMTVLRRDRLASYLIMISARTSCWWKFIAAQHGV